MKLSTLAKNHEAWTGDAALMFMARTVLIERYPDMPIRCLYDRLNSIVSNRALTGYCRRHNLPYGCNLLEVEIGKKILINPDEVKSIVEDIVSNNDLCIRLDKEQTTNGRVKPEFLALINHRERRKQIKQRIFKVVDKVPITYRRKHRIYSKISYLFDKLFPARKTL
jgi:dsRNA-specific ribonuclease